jgi:hypothetical protein
MNGTLHFQMGNAKLKRDTLILSLSAGHSCPFAKDCRSSSDRATGKIKDGPHTQYRCYATAAEALFPVIRRSRWDNFELIKQAGTVICMAKLIEDGITNRRKVKLVRFHQSGDFFNQAYFDAWLLVAQQHPELLFYGYTKALPFWVKRLHAIPANMKLVASRGGTHDSLISMFGLRAAQVVLSVEEAAKLGLEIDHDDTHVWKYDKDFAILIHGTQPAGSAAGRAWYQLCKVQKVGGYKSQYFKGYVSDGKGGKCKKSSLRLGKAILVPVVAIKPVGKRLVNPNPRAGKFTIATKALAKVLAHA